MVEPMALRLHNNQSFPDQLGYAVHQTAVQTMAHLKKDTVLILRGEGDFIKVSGVEVWCSQDD
eukprot:scaffold120540_cov55-Attheya_sp.AAC.1